MTCQNDDDIGWGGVLVTLLIAFAFIGIAQHVERANHPPDKFDRIDSFSSDGNVIHTYIPKPAKSAE